MLSLKNIFFAIFGVTFVSVAVFGDALTREEYEAQFNLTSGDEGDRKAIERCLSHWGEHPFKTEKAKKFRKINTSVSVFGLTSGADVSDFAETKDPQLVLISPSVNVLGKQTYQLNNPNGWYCIKANVTVLAKTIISADCNAKIAYTSGVVPVLGSTEAQGGVTVLGKTAVKKETCNAKI
jgi:hypothetical protein